jgi:hypothetical protein
MNPPNKNTKIKLNKMGSNKIPYTSYKVENALGKIKPSINVADRMQSIVAYEFDKIRKALNI